MLGCQGGRRGGQDELRRLGFTYKYAIDTMYKIVTNRIYCIRELYLVFYSDLNGKEIQKRAYMYVCMLSCFSRVHLSATPWTVALQTPLSIGFSRQEYWSRLSYTQLIHFTVQQKLIQHRKVTIYQ